MASRKGKKNVTKKAIPKAPENLEITVQYSSRAGVLTEDEKKKFIKNLKKEHYYYDYLSGKFKFAFEDSMGSTLGTFLWKGGAGDQREASERVIALLLGDFDILPEGVKAKLIKTEDVYKKNL
jgi:hypothetical protein